MFTRPVTLARQHAHGLRLDLLEQSLGLAVVVLREADEPAGDEHVRQQQADHEGAEFHVQWRPADPEPLKAPSAGSERSKRGGFIPRWAGR
jgi:hypothetical protein